MAEKLAKYICTIADNNLILGQRLSELCGHGPELETDIALTNVALDLLGQTRNYYQYAASLLGKEADEDTLAFLRKENEYRNVLLVEQPNTDFAHVILRQFVFDTYHLYFLTALQDSTDETLSAIAKKSIKEVRYHYRFSSDWLKRLGDGTEKSKQKAQEALEKLWAYTDELFYTTDIEKEMIASGVGVDVSSFKSEFDAQLKAVFDAATLSVPEEAWFHKGGKEGRHSEHMGYLLTDLQYMQRTYPDSQW